MCNKNRTKVYFQVRFLGKYAAFCERTIEMGAIGYGKRKRVLRMRYNRSNAIPIQKIAAVHL